MKQIQIQLNSSGDVKAEALGFTGEGCSIALNTLLQGLSGNSEHTNKPEMYEKEEETYLTE